MNDIVLYPSKMWSVLLAVICLIAGTLCVGVLVFQGEVDTKGSVLIEAGIGAVFLWGAFFVNIYRLFKPVPSFIVNREGITDHASVIRVGLVRWEETAGVTVHRDRVTLLAIMLKDPETYYKRLPAEKVAALREAAKRRPVHIGIPQATLPEPVDTLSQQIMAYRQALSVAANPAPAPPARPSMAPPVATPAETLPSQRCSACGASSQGTKFCPGCGQPMPQRSQCSKCGAQVKATTKFCPDCGSKIV